MSGDKKDEGLPGDRLSRASMPPDGNERRSFVRVDVGNWDVDCTDGDNFLYSYITNISEMGIFIHSRTPPDIDRPLRLRFTAPGEEAMDLEGVVAWINPYRPNGENLNPGFGVRFTNLAPEQRERLVALVHAIAYLPDDA
jgi:type IV pilus assembly protein PilZ